MTESRLPFLSRKSELGRMMAGHDWSQSPLGEPSQWPVTLQSAVSLMLESKFPMFIAWGDELGFLYNDPYSQILGEKHPAALGNRFEAIWGEIWPDIKPLIDRALGGEASWLDDLPLTMNRYGYDEQTWFTFSYSPVRDAEGVVRGLFCACTETTEKVRAIRNNEAERERLERLFAQAPGFMAVLQGPQHVFQLTNDAYRRLIGGREVIGSPIREALPELAGQGFYELLDSVYESGEAFIGQAQPLLIQRQEGQAAEQAYVDFIYQPVTDSAGTVTGIFVEGYDVTEQYLADARQERHACTMETLNRVGAAVSSQLDIEKIVDQVTDAGVSLIGAGFGAFFYNVTDENGDALVLYSLTGADRSQFDDFGHPRPTPVFRPTFEGTAVVRSADITADPRYGQNPPHEGMPKGHLPVKSYLAVPVKSRSGEVLGGLFFGHEEAGRFTPEHEDLIVGIAAQAAIAIDNAQLYRDAQMEIAQRRKIEKQQSLLINELNHRVKNTLAIVQGLARQSLKGDRSTFDARLGALAAAHNLLTRQNWAEAELSEIIGNAVEATAGALAERVSCHGPAVVLPPQTAVSLAMAVHELSTNAIKYGALSNETGSVDVHWEIVAGADDQRLKFEWCERGGPPVIAPDAKGFGSRMIERGLAAELRGTVELEFAPAGLCCRIDAPMPKNRS